MGFTSLAASAMLTEDGVVRVDSDAGPGRRIVHGATDEIGFHAIDERHYVTCIHAMILHPFRLDSRRREIPADERLEIDHGLPIHAIV